MTAVRDNEEFKRAILDIAQYIKNLQSPFDRVRCVEWCRRIICLPEDNLEMSKLKNEYIQMLRIQVRNNFLHGPFTCPPEENNTLCPLPELLGNLIAKQVPYLPTTGPIAPAIHHKSPDGRAYVSIKRIPKGGVLCYLAVSPDGLS